MIAGKQEQAFTVQAGRQIFTAKLNDVVALALALAGMQADRKGRLGETELLKELTLSGFAGPQVCAVGGGSVDQRAYRLWWQFYLLFDRRELFVKGGNAIGSLFLWPVICPSWVNSACQLLSS